MSSNQNEEKICLTLTREQAVRLLEWEEYAKSNSFADDVLDGELKIIIRTGLNMPQSH